MYSIYKALKIFILCLFFTGLSVALVKESVCTKNQFLHNVYNLILCDLADVLTLTVLILHIYNVSVCCVHSFNAHVPIYVFNL